jgi:predicted Zn-ribbon and HTH transcriptional regulator
MVEPSQPGIRKCLSCGWKFVSPDQLRIARCQDCKSQQDQYQPREVQNHQVNGAYRAHRDNS